MGELALSIDWEDYFQVYNFSKIIDYEDWYLFRSRIRKNTIRILNILKEHNTHATFFILGWNAERFPDLVRMIKDHGHEIACHGYSHKPVTKMSKKEFQEDLKKSVKAIKKACGVKPVGFRASTFSITKKTLWALDVLRKNGFKYDSSMVPIKHPDYGVKCKKQPFLIKGMIEFPITTHKKFPIGGGYFRLYPYFLTKKIIKRHQRAIFYIHPWEFDHKQPRYPLPFTRRLRHYQNLRTTERKFRKLLKDFDFKRIDEVLHL